MTNSLTTAAQNASPYSAPPAKDCNFCGKTGLLILPVRCSTLPKEAGAPALPGNIGAHVKDIPIGLSTYTLRTARVGYLYMLVNRQGALEWQSYISNAEGYWYKFAIDNPPLTPPEFTCKIDTHGINASMVAIYKAEDVKTAYLIFTPSPLTEDMLSDKNLKNIAKAEAMCAKGQMVKFSPADWVKGTYQQTHCLQSGDLATSVAEFALFEKANGRPIFSTPLGKGLCNATFPLMSDGTGIDPVATGGLHLSRLGSLTNTMGNSKAVAVAVYDHIGIAQELNDFRNDAFNKVNDFLNKADKEGVTNRWKFDSLQAISQIKTGLETGLINDAMRSIEMKESHLRARYEPNFPDDTPEMRRLKLGWNNAYSDTDRKTWPQRQPQKSAELEAKLAKLHAEEPKQKTSQIANAKEEAQKRWTKTYAPLLDDKAMADFDKDFGAATQAATDLAATRVDDHLAWVLHDRFVDAFDIYDRKNKASGILFEGQSALCSMGMSGIEKSAQQIDAWLQAPVDDRKNIYMRGLLLNQDAIIKEASTALNAAAKVAQEHEPTTAAMALTAGGKMYDTLKGLIKFFAAADKAWDEYVRESEKKGNARSKGLEKTWEGGKLFKMSEINRTLFRKGISGFEKKWIGYFGGLAWVKLGGLAEELRFEQLMYGINPEKPHIDPATGKEYLPGKEPVKDPSKPTTGADPAAAREASKAAAAEAEAAQKKMMTVAQYRDMQRKAGITFTAEEYLKRPSHMTSNYHQVRISGFLGVLESFSFGYKMYQIAKKGGGTSIEYWEAGASLLAVSSIGCDMAYGMAKSARETATDTAVRGAGDVIRGGWKLWAGGLAALAGICTVISDFAKLQEEKNGANRTPQKNIILMRMFVGIWNTGFGAAVAYSYSGPLFRRIASNLAIEATKRRAAYAGAARIAEWLGTRVLLLRLVAWGTGAGLVLTVGEIGYNIYLWYQPTALEIWMQRSVFRNRNLKGNAFTRADSELEELASARKLVGV